MTNQEFKNLKRNAHGDIVEIYSVWNYLTEYQVDQLTGDDWSRYHELMDEVELEMQLM